MEMRTLEGSEPRLLYAAFREAFADYEVPVTWSQAEFEAANARRGFDPTVSLGAFEDGRMVGFVFNGRGAWGGVPTVYDMGTGVVPSARGSALAGKIAERLKEMLPGLGIRRYLLEVIRDNAPALKTYERAGFRVTRNFECPGGTFADPGRPAPAGVRVEELAAFPRAQAAAMRDWEPSWQNSDDSIARNPTPLVMLGAREDGRAGGRPEGRLLGCLVAAPNGTIWQLAVDRGARRRGIGTALLRSLAARSGGAIRYINVQSDDEASLGLLARCGAGEGPGQHEMVLGL